ncbi:MAG: adenine-specific methyltransferase EcoRI family protein, partial [Rhabdochlamydiaceae bacterium]
EYAKKFLIIGNKNCVTYKEIFPLIKDNKFWSGSTEWSGGLWFETMNSDDVDKVIDGVKMKNVSSVWFTNLDHGRRHQPLQLMTMADNLKFNKKMAGKTAYDHYDNYDAIEVPFTNAIPRDFGGVMGVPISFLDKYDPEQFEILGMCENEDLYNMKTKKYTGIECKGAYLAKFDKKGTYDLNASGVVIHNGLYEKVYQRVLLKHRKAIV